MSANSTAGVAKNPVHQHIHVRESSRNGIVAWCRTMQQLGCWNFRSVSRRFDSRSLAIKRQCYVDG